MNGWNEWNGKTIFNCALITTFVAVLTWEAVIFNFCNDNFLEDSVFWFWVAGIVFGFIAICFWIGYWKELPRFEKLSIWKIALIILAIIVAVFVLLWQDYIGSWILGTEPPYAPLEY